MRATTTLIPACATGFVLLFTTAARAQVSKPLPGITMVRTDTKVMVIADLCSPGVSMRTTKFGERLKLASDWAATSGADVATNGDFFVGSSVVGRAKGAGEAWPKGNTLYLNEGRHDWEFGPGFARLVDSLPEPGADATDIVGAHNVIISGGQPVDDGDGVLGGAAQRTGAGMNAAKDHFYLFASRSVLNRTTLTADMISFAAQGGAPALDIATRAGRRSASAFRQQRNFLEG